MYSFGPAWGYLDGDRFPDLFIAHHYGHERHGLQDLLLRNTGDGSFATSSIELSPRTNPRFPRDLHAAVWAPLSSDSPDRDDLYVSVGGRQGDLSKRGEIEHLLFRNEPEGLINRARELGLQELMSSGPLLRGRLAIPIDYDQDGRLDLLLTGDRSPFRMLRGTDYGFLDRSEETALNTIRPGAEDGWRASVADLDGDHYEDLILGTGPRSSLFVFSNRAGARFEYEPDWTSSMTGIVASWARPTGSDQFPDLFLLPRNIGPGSPIRWIESPNGRGGREHLIVADGIHGRGLQLTGGDFDNDGDDDLVVLSRRAVFLIEARGESWIDVTAESGLHEIFNAVDEGLFSCVSMADYDLDGRLDLIASRGQGGPGRQDPPPGPIEIARNTSEAAGNWLRLRLRGRASNPLALGAAIEISLPDGGTRYRSITNSVTGTCQNDSAVHLGIAGAPFADLRISWPSGARTDHSDVEANQLVVIEEPVPAAEG